VFRSRVRALLVFFCLNAGDRSAPAVFSARRRD
jgi:hypothetical protein